VWGKKKNMGSLYKFPKILFEGECSQNWVS
jgi:hypothetical protein